MKKAATSSLLAILALSTSVSAADIKGNLTKTFQQFPIEGLDQVAQSKIDQVLSRHGIDYLRPEACPLKSRGYQDILGKIENIKGLFKDPSCLDDPTALDKVVTNATSLKESLNTTATDVGIDTTDMNQSVSVQGTEIDGEKIGQVVDNLNNLFFKNKCGLDRGTVLERSADIIQNFAQLGLIVPNSNGLVIAGGGMAVSSLLRMLNALFTEKFNFEDNKDRLNFIKLNCAFYDIRRDIENSGMVDVALPAHRESKAEIEELIKLVENKIKAVSKNKGEVLNGLSKAQVSRIESDMGAMVQLEKVLNGLVGSLSQKIETQDQKLQAILKMESVKQSLEELTTQYLALDLNRVTVFDTNLKETLKSLGDVNALISQGPKDFNNGLRSSLLFHAKRIQDDLQKMRSELTAKYVKESTIDGESLAQFKKNLDKKSADITKALQTKLANMKAVHKRLERIVGTDTGYSRADDGTENVNAILSNYDAIAEQIYGKWGYEFLKYTTKTATKVNKEFKDKFESFAENHLNKEGSKLVVPKSSSKDDLRKMFACQDAKRPRMDWVRANSLAQQGYDFVATNKELFHSDIPRVFLGTSGERLGVHAKTNRFEKIQAHHKSSLFARKLLKGEAVSDKNKERYLGKRARRKKYLGTVMLQVEKSKKDVALVQELIENFDCSKITTVD